MTVATMYRASWIIKASRAILLLLVVFGYSTAVLAQVAVAPSPVAKQQFFGVNGAPLASGCIFTYISTTSTPLATYSDYTGTALNPNPIILDSGGFASIWLSNATYRFVLVSAGGVNCASGVTQYTIDGISAYTIVNSPQNLFLLGATSDPGGTAGELAYRTDIPCFRGFTAFWDCFVTQTATQTLTNKTLTAPIINTPTIITPTISTPIVNGAATGTGIQGTGAKLMSSGVISGTLAAPLCLDAQSGATTTGCAPTNGAAAGCTAIGPVTITNNNAAQNLLSCSVLANALSAGSLLNVDLTGVVSSAAGQTITISMSLGGGTACAATYSAGIANFQPFNYVAKFSVITSGAGGTANISCEIFGPGAAVAGNNGVVGLPTISVNTTINNTLLITEQMGTLNAGNSVTGQLLKGVVF
jgi:hypothetical protein